MNFPHTPQSAGKGGFALILTLAILVIVSALLLGFMSATQNRRIASHSYSRSAQAQEIALGALAQIASDLQSEIINNSTASPVVANTGFTNAVVPYGSSVTTIYQANSATNLVPMPFGFNTNNTNLVNLIGVSTNSATPNTDDSSTNPSADGRYISTARWNTPLFMPPTSTTNLTPSNNFIAPDWIIVTRSGPQRNATDANVTNGTSGYNVADPSNTNFAVGRFAYTIYDEGGLLNVNVAGYNPSTVGGSTVGGKETTVWADLTQIGMAQTDIDILGQWRNPSTWANSNSYASNAIDLSTNFGFTRVTTGNNALLSRQELISYVTGQIPNSITNLPNLTTFSVALNSPSYLPSTNAAPADVTNTIGTYFLNGAPLRRFPLNTRLAELNTNPSSADISTYFGLKQGAGFASPGFRNWTYDTTKLIGGKIATIAQAIQAGRQPNFFEILKTAILQGSLATQAGAGARNSYTWESGTAAAIDNQVIRIGANIIDQYNPDNYPATITINGLTFYGIEDLPYFSKIYAQYTSPQIPGSAGGAVLSSTAGTNTSFTLNAYHYFELWNPHQAPTTNVPSPTNLRIRADTNGTFVPDMLVNGTTFYDFGSGTVTWPVTTIDVTTNSTYFRNNPHLVQNGTNNLQNLGVPVNAFVLSKTWQVKPGALPTNGQAFVYSTYQNTMLILEYSTNGATYYPYATLSGLVPGGIVSPTSDGGINNGTPWVNVTGTNGLYPAFAFMKPDPRTDRLGINGLDTPNAANMIDLPMIISASQGTNTYANGGFPSTLYQSTYANSNYPGTLVCNTGKAQATDNDNVARPGDAYLNEPSADPMTQTNARPIILHRPFRSVGELGYAFRDQPWKTLNFFSGTNSADAALLDVFCLTDTDTAPAPAAGSTTPDTRNNLIEGQVDLNSRNSQVLAAILSGSISQFTTGIALSSSDATTNATSLTTFTATNPMAGPADLVTKYMNSITNSSNLVTNSASSPLSAIKQQREAIVRALASTGQARTWNLLIDVIAQSGRFPSTAQKLNQFQVEGERRYWLHLAIDRPTGKVISEVLEPVTE